MKTAKNKKEMEEIIEEGFSNMAFPLYIPNRNGFANSGMTLRDYFATHSPFGVNQGIDIVKGCGDRENAESEKVAEALAQLNYLYADAMIKEREKC